MSISCATGLSWWWFRGAVCLVLVLACASAAMAQSPATVVRIEEDWELVIGTPDADRDAPQVTCVTSPLGNCDGLYAAFELNHQSLPSFVPGGLQLQIWHGEAPVGERSATADGVLADANETVRWTQAMSVHDGTLTFEIVDGSSSTWGTFGGRLRVRTAATVADLNGYSPAASAENSGIGYAGNRVTSLKLQQVRLYTSTGDVVVDSTERVVHSQP